MTLPVKFANVNFFRCGRIISLLALCSLLQACGTVKIAYNQGATLAYLYLDGYLDFNDVQSAQVKSELNRFQAWHRQTQLPAYVELLQKVQQKMPQDITEKQACDVYADVRQKALAMTDFAEPATLSLAPTLSPKQLNAMERKFAKGNSKWRDDFLDGSAKEAADRRQKSAVKRGEMLYGDINDKQRALIAQQIEKSPFKAPQSYAERQRRQKDILQTLGRVSTSPLDNDAVRKDIAALLARSVTSPDAAYRNYIEQVTQESCANFAELHNTTTPEQRKKAVQVLASYEQDFKALASQR